MRGGAHRLRGVSQIQGLYRLGMSLVAAVLVGAVTGPASAAQQGAAAEPPSPRLVTSGTNAVLQAVHPVDDDVVWVSGHEGTILRSTDGGATWVTVPGPAGDTLQFRDVGAFSSEEAIVLSSGSGALSRIYRTSDGGRSWTLGFLMEDEAGFLDCMDFWDRDRGFAYGDAIDGVPYILSTTDGGRTWNRVPSQSLPAALPGEGGFAASGTCAMAGPDGRGWIATGAGGAARMLTTSDYGDSWSVRELPMATGSMAGAFTIATHQGEPVMILGGDLGRAEDVVPNAVRPGEGSDWIVARTRAPLAGAVYGSAAVGPMAVVAFGPQGSAYTPDVGERWMPMPDVQAWAGAWSPGGSLGWAVGTGGRIWRLTR